MTSVVSIVNFKGGVGKSTVAFNLSYELAKKDKSVLMIDFDGQGNLSKFAGIVHLEKNLITALEAMMENTKIENPITKINKNLDIITCDIRKENWKNKAVSRLARETILKEYIDILKKEHNYDYIIIDNAPSIGLDFQNSLVASNFYLIVTEAEIASTDGIKTMYSIINQIKKYFNKNLKCLGILKNKVQSRTQLHNLVSDLIEKSWEDEIYIFNKFIPKSIIAAESEVLQKSIKETNKDSKISKAFDEFTDEFLSRVYEENLKKEK